MRSELGGAGQEVMVIILNWRQPTLTIESLQAIQRMKEAERCHFLIIDNGSGDNSVEILESAAVEGGFELLANAENLGFGRGNNIGLQLAIDRGYRYALLINNDAFPHPEMLHHLLQAAESGSDIGLLAPKIYYDPDRERIWYYRGRMQRGSLNLRESGRGEIDRGQFERDIDCDYLLGTCLLVNLEALTTGGVGLFDDRFFMYYEDIDWSLRMRDAGYRLRVIANSHLYHRVATSSGGENSPLQIYNLTKSSFIFFRKHYSKGNLFVIALYRLGNGLKIMGRALMQGNFKKIWAYMRGVIEGLSQ